MARADGGSGQLLGQALAGDLDGIRCWVCALLMWSARAAGDPLMPKGKGKADVYRAAADARVLSVELCPSVLGDGRDEAVVFVRDVLAVLARRCAFLAGGGEGQGQGQGQG